MEHKKNFFLAFFWTLGIAVACLISVSQVPKVSIFGSDKSVHAFFYFGFTLLWYFFLTKEKPHWSFFFKSAIILFSAFLYGGILEICQGLFTDSRTADSKDVLANMSGSTVGILILALLEKFQKKKQI